MNGIHIRGLAFYHARGVMLLNNFTDPGQQYKHWTKGLPITGWFCMEVEMCT